MFCRGIARAASVAPRSGVRALSTTTALSSHTPSMGDINPSASSVDAFNKKQKEYREQLLQAQKERDARAFAAKEAAAASKSAESDTSSLDTDAGRTADVKDKDNGRKSGPLTNLIYGTKEGREMEAQIEASFSQVLARGKYVHSIVFHQVKPDKVDEYVKLVGDFYPKMANDPANKVHLVGSWRTEVGDCDTFGTYPCNRPQRLLLTNRSSHLGVPEIRRLPRISTLDHSPP